MARLAVDSTFGNSVAGAAQAAAPWVERLARLGYAAKGTVYLLIGWIAARAALGDGHAEGSHGALASLLAAPFGKALLALVAVGLLGYALWRAVEGIADPERRGTDAKGLAVRGYMLASAVLHAGLCLGAVRLLLGDPGGGQDATRHWTARLMAQPAGRFLVALVGIAVLLAAFQQLGQAIGRGYRRHVRLDLLEPRVARWLGPVARLGLASRGLVFFVVGSFFLVAAWRADPARAKGLGDALATLEAQPGGAALGLAVALGLAAYGAYELVKARYRVIAPL
jgi:hypothetical protein